MIAIFGYWSLRYVKAISKIYNISFKKTFVIFLGIFALFFLFCFIFFYEDRIYKVSKYCKPTENPKIKICKFSNGVYMGELKAFLRHGEGVYKFNSGASYSGGWQNNLRHGTGITITNTIIFFHERFLIVNGFLQYSLQENILRTMLFHFG